ncbi:MAG: pyrroline-5-carboxylate reductase [Candidatus Bathyarchaeota archaeon]|nr:pyrroline-5-carboxylate reductase [Candidatus Bathyarchaeota archaeon]
MKLTEKIAVLGAGMIGGAITKAFLKGGCKSKIAVSDFMPAKVAEMKELGVAATSDNCEAAKGADVIFICVKPADVQKLLKEIANEVKGKIVVSSAATVPLSYLKQTLPTAKFVRMMPNLAILVQASYTAYCCEAEVTAQDKETVKALLDLMGVSQEVDEKYMDAITGLSGSGPGYLSIILEAVMYGGLKMGLPRDIAMSAAAQTMLGTGKLVLGLQEHPAKIRDMITTPGGTTINAIYELEGSQARQALMKAVEEATKKSQAIREKILKTKQP